MTQESTHGRDMCVFVLDQSRLALAGMSVIPAAPRAAEIVVEKQCASCAFKELRTRQVNRGSMRSTIIQTA
jgi:hypothetical protein